MAQKGLESKLTAAMHSLELLKEAVSSEERGLQADRTLLEDLERDSRAEERIWRQRAKKVCRSPVYLVLTMQMHPLLELPEMGEQPDDGMDEIGLVKDSLADGSVLDTDDADLAAILGQMRNHLDSIRSNRRQMGGVAEGITRASVALSGLLHQDT
jgi:CENP-Q, a CENPA-CAD centromere complex subunit